jgi:predicted MFS family arabinose efflux permease
LNAVASRLFGAVGAFAGGFVIPTLGIANCYFIVAGANLVRLLLVALMPRIQEANLGQDRPSLREALVGGATLIVALPTVRTLVIAAMACEIVGFSYMTAVPTLARDVLQVGAEGLGTLTAASSIGATIAVLLLTALPSRQRREPILTGVYLLYGVSILAFAASPTLLLAAVAIVVVGGCASAFDALQQTMIQLAVPENQRGRAVGVWVFSIGTAPIGHLEIGALASGIGAPLALGVNGALVVLGAVILALRSPAFWPGRRNVRQTLP